ncbi:MAG: hypothetical protein JSS29_03320 [Proteobacteria bacterium]|nr:hypothetical protein [Pseudomonadota bacterium]
MVESLESERQTAFLAMAAAGYDPGEFQIREFKSGVTTVTVTRVQKKGETSKTYRSEWLTALEQDLQAGAFGSP